MEAIIDNVNEKLHPTLIKWGDTKRMLYIKGSDYDNKATSPKALKVNLYDSEGKEATGLWSHPYTTQEMRPLFIWLVSGYLVSKKDNYILVSI